MCLLEQITNRYSINDYFTTEDLNKCFLCEGQKQKFTEVLQCACSPEASLYWSPK